MGKTLTILDGGTGRELEAQGASIAPPLWSANALYSDPNLVKEVHGSFIRAGATVITTNTYAITRYHLRNAGKIEDQQRLLDLAYRQAQLAKEEADTEVLIAASLPPLSESYRGDLVPEDQALEEEYTFLIDTAQKHQVDILLGETLSQAREAKMIYRLAKATTLPVWISFTVDESGNLRGGESLREVAAELIEMGVEVMLVNCSTQKAISAAIDIFQELVKHFSFQYGAYGNRYDEIRKDYTLALKSTTIRREITPEQYTNSVKSWVSRGATIVGGCCGIGPEYIDHMTRNLHFKSV